MNLGLGIDTGGTYTDSVIIDLDDGKVLSKSKALTTRNDLSIGISNSIDVLDASLLNLIKLVSVSSTLATNSVVEGKGCRVGLIVAGYEFDRSIQVEEAIQIKGGHGLNGEMKEPLDLETARNFVLAVKDKVDGFAISSYLSVRNPEHEIALKRMLESLTSNPVVCGHDLSSKLGFNERTVTAVLNAKLIPIIADLVTSVKSVLRTRNIEAPLMIVKGDGSLMGESVAKQRPVETILSGPAASLTGARYLTGEDEAVVIDVGGTTTDIGILRKGKPRLDPEGALIGGWRTRVRAADISTSGIGGDSRVVVHNGKINLAPLRVVPLCIASAMSPRMLEKLEKVRNVAQRAQPSYLDIARVSQTTEFFVFSKNVNGYELSRQEKTFVELVKQEPRSIQEISEITHEHPFSLEFKRLEEIGIIQRFGLTPTDILHAEGSYVEYDPTASKIGVEIQAKALGMSPIDFCQAVKRAVIEKIATELAKKLICEETGETQYCRVASDFVNKFVKLEDGIDYSCRMRLNKSIIGIGAPVGTYLPAVAERLGTKLSLPEHMEVGNAVGAITGSIIESVEILIKPKHGMGVMDDPPCDFHSSEEKKEFETLTEAIAYAKNVAAESATERAIASGAESVEVVVENNEMRAKLGRDWGN
ncbi:MAG: hydantoinase/oxoprolinase family protein, partial [Methanomassiliicoccales archaeon]|nr:hydantoinase/oxoprolinase family protein [Methanomassiliicoccales archaeon]